MKLFTSVIERKLLDNGLKTAAAQAAGKTEPDHKPVLKIFNPTGGATWLISEIVADSPDTLYGLCDLGAGEPELGYVSRAELEGIRVRFGLGLERDRWFKANKPLSEYTKEANANQRIVA
jgi:hypothetical protein